MLCLSISFNVRAWIKKSHNILDINAYIDRAMLNNMLHYVERVRRCVKNYPFIVDDNEEMER